uniref:Uncharacterized protein n=2 Tax=Rhizophora mucronata TaxID=61149 RepID=A0A2P2LDB0_RHIMU
MVCRPFHLINVVSWLTGSASFRLNDLGKAEKWLRRKEMELELRQRRKYMRLKMTTSKNSQAHHRICMGVMKIGQLEIITAAEPMETIRGNLELVY